MRAKHSIGSMTMRFCPRESDVVSMLRIVFGLRGYLYVPARRIDAEYAVPADLTLVGCVDLGLRPRATEAC